MMNSVLNNTKAGIINGAIIIDGHIQGLSNLRSLGELGIPIYVIDKDIPLCYFSRYCKKLYRCNDYSTNSLIDLLIDIAQTNNIQNWLIVPSNDHIVKNLSYNLDKLVPYYKMFVPEPTELENIINKLSLMRLASDSNVPIPGTCSIIDIERAKSFRYPLLVKGNEGLTFYKTTHCKAIKATSYENLLLVIQNLTKILPEEEIMIQELVQSENNDKAVSYTCFADEGIIKAHWTGKKLREHPIEYGTATAAVSTDIPELTIFAERLIQSLNFSGVCEIEFMKDSHDGVYKLIEINPRTWLWVGLAKACGVDYAKIMYEFASGIEPHYPNYYEIGIIWKNTINDIAFGVKSLVNGKMNKCNIFSIFSRDKIVRAVWSWKDILPGIILPFMLPYIYFKRK